jgi:tyrosine-protein kinase Etk/Wzc
MEIEQYNFSVEENQENSLKDLLVKYLFHWKWFVLSIVISMVVGRFYYKRQTPLYEVSATILIKDDSKGQLSELSAFEDLGLLKKNNNIDNEIEVLKSRSLMMRVVEELKINTTYFVKERHLESELYKNSPVQLTFTGLDSSYRNKWASYFLTFETKNTFVLKTAEEEEL